MSSKKNELFSEGLNFPGKKQCFSAVFFEGSDKPEILIAYRGENIKTVGDVGFNCSMDGIN